MTGKTKQNQLEAIVERTLQETPFEVVLVEYKKEGSNWVLRTFIDHPEGVTLDHCQSASRLIADALEQEDPVQQNYNIEVSSPGVDRPLAKPGDFERFLNERVFVKTRRAVDGRKSFTGELEASADREITVRNESDGQSYVIARELIAKATLKPILKFN